MWYEFMKLIHKIEPCWEYKGLLCCLVICEMKSIPAIIAYTFCAQKCNYYLLKLCRSLVVKKSFLTPPSPPFFPLFFSDTLNQAFNQIRCVYQQTGTKRALFWVYVCVWGGPSTILIEIHATIFGTHVLKGDPNCACGSQIPVCLRITHRTCGNAGTWVHPKPTESESLRVSPRNFGCFFPS